MRCLKVTFYAFILFFLYLSLQAKILIFTYAYNRPDFIEIQHKTLKKFLEDDYEFIVFNDAPGRAMMQHINDMCARFGIRCIRIPQHIHTMPYLPRPPGSQYNHPTVRNVNVVQYSLNTLGFDNNDIVVLLDSDMFLVKNFSIREFLEGYDLGGRQLGRGNRVAQGDILYLWHGLTFLDMRSMPNHRTLNFNCGRVEGKPVDAGGHSYYYFKNNPGVKARYVDHNFSDELQCIDCKRRKSVICTHNTEQLIKVGFDQNQIDFLQMVPVGGPFLTSSVEFYHNNSFLHYRCGSNWDNRPQHYHNQKTAALRTYLNAILGEAVRYLVDCEGDWG